MATYLRSRRSHLRRLVIHIFGAPLAGPDRIEWGTRLVLPNLMSEFYVFDHFALYDWNFDRNSPTPPSGRGLRYCN